MGSHRVINKAHVRIHPDGRAERFDIGDVLDPTEAEMEAFGDKFQRIDGKKEEPKVDDSAPKLSSEAATKPDIAQTHETVAARPRRERSGAEDKGDAS